MFQAIAKSNWANSMSFQGLGIILCGLRLRSLDLWLQTCSHSSFFLKGINMFAAHPFSQLVSCLHKFGGLTPTSSISPSRCPSRFKLAVFLLVSPPQERHRPPVDVMGLHFVTQEALPRRFPRCSQLYFWLLLGWLREYTPHLTQRVIRVTEQSDLLIFSRD